MNKVTVRAVCSFCPRVSSTGHISYDPFRESQSQFYKVSAGNVRGVFHDAMTNGSLCPQDSEYTNCYGRQQKSDLLPYV